jgi:DNA adenine methylase
VTCLKAPFPYFGGKSTAAAIVWERFGKVPNYVEPFFGSGAVLLGRPHEPKTETVNDFDGFLVNAWRALAHNPDATAHFADWPVSEADLEARHYWLVTKGRERLAEVLSDPEGFDAKIAGWWIWGACCWIGSGWCKGDGPWSVDESGVWVKEGSRREGVFGKLPHVGNAGRGIHRQLPHVGDAGQGIARRNSLPIHDYFDALSSRLRRVRIAHGDFERVLGESVTVRHGLTGVFLDPPYITDCENVYSHSDTEPARRAAAWCKENGNNPALRIALCGYVGEHDLPGWECYRWKARGGYGSQGEGRGRENAAAECIWFSPHCLAPMQAGLFETTNLE